MAKIIDGKAISQTIQQEVKQEIAAMKEKGLRAPGLAVILVGERKDSQTYVRSKKRVAAELGMVSFDATFPADISEENLLRAVSEYNANPEVDGILVQLPLPSHINEEKVLSAIDVTKDVDGFHPHNIGSLAMKGREPLFVSCTPQGCMELLDRSGVQIQGKHAVVLGRSNIVGLPVSLLLLERNATVTICHSRTPNIPAELSRADIIIAACGQAQIVKKDWVKPGAVVIDVGMNSIDNGKGDGKTRLVGDVDYNEVKEVAGSITPVPGGVGPMTIIMLMRNTLKSAKMRLDKQKPQ